MADATTTTLNPTDLAWLALADKALLTPDEQSMLETWRDMVSNPHVQARIDFLLAP